MSSAVAEQPSGGDVSFADILEEADPAAGDSAGAAQPGGPPPAGGGSGAGADRATAGDADPEQASGDPAAAAPAPKTAAVPSDAESVVEFVSVPPSTENAPPAAANAAKAPAGAAAAASAGAAKAAPAGSAKAADPAKAAEPPLTELEKLWKPVKENPADFTAWTLLIQYAEAQCLMEDVRKVLDAFLGRYSYCYGYWKKYSDLEKKKGTPERCEQVLERGLRAVPLSVDFWLHYVGHVRATCEAQPAKIRAAFERAVAACGLEFRSDRLWEQYASWETLNKEPTRALAVYRRAIGVPTLSYRTHFENLEQFVGETPPQELLTVGEFLEARRAVLAELKGSEPAPVEPTSDLLPPGCDEAPPGVPAQPAGLSSDDEGVRLRARILTPLRERHKENEKQVALRWTFEEAIKRPYFHVKPLERAQLKNWKAYLDFEIEQGDKERIRVLFERCLIACALYEEYWMKYIRYLESEEPADPDRVRAVYQRACWTHLPDKPSIHMLWATFEEKHGDLERAYEVVERLCDHVNLLEVTQRRVNLARRRGHLDLAERLYADTLKACTHRQQAVIMAIKFVRFLYKVRGDRTKAEEVLREAIRQDPANQRLYLQLVDLGFQSRPVDVSLVQEAFRMALASPLELRDRLLFAHRRVEFLEEFGEDIQSLQEAQEEYYSLARTAKAEAKRRKQETEEAEETKTAGGAAVVSAAKRPAPATSVAQNGTEKKARQEPAQPATAGLTIPTISPAQARPAKSGYQPAAVPPAAAAVAAAVAPYSQPPPPAPVHGFGGYGQPPPQQPPPPPPPPPPQQQQQYYPGYQYPPAGPAGWGYPGQYNYNQYGQGYQYPYH